MFLSRLRLSLLQRAYELSSTNLDITKPTATRMQELGLLPAIAPLPSATIYRSQADEIL